MTKNSSNEKLATIGQLSKEINLPVRTIQTLYRNSKIRHIKAGHRTLLFNTEQVLDDLAKYTVATLNG